MFFSGSDELSNSLSSIVNDERIRLKLESDRFVAIKIQSDSPAYGQFAQLCKTNDDSVNGSFSISCNRFADKLVPVPSLFFIGTNGVPLEIVTGITKSVEELDAKIENVLKQFDSTSASFIAGKRTIRRFFQGLLANVMHRAGEQATAEVQSTQSADPEVVCEGGVCYKRPKENKPEEPKESDASTSAAAPAPASPELTTEEKVLRAKELIEKKRKAKEEEEARVY